MNIDMDRVEAAVRAEIGRNPDAGARRLLAVMNREIEDQVEEVCMGMFRLPTSVLSPDLFATIFGGVSSTTKDDRR